MKLFARKAAAKPAKTDAERYAEAAARTAAAWNTVTESTAYRF